MSMCFLYYLGSKVIYFMTNNTTFLVAQSQIESIETSSGQNILNLDEGRVRLEIQFELDPAKAEGGAAVGWDPKKAIAQTKELLGLVSIEVEETEINHNTLAAKRTIKKVIGSEVTLNDHGYPSISIDPKLIRLRGNPEEHQEFIGLNEIEETAGETAENSTEAAAEENSMKNVIYSTFRLKPNI